MIAPARLWRTTDGAVVAEGNPEAAFLLVGKGCEIPDADQADVEEFLAANPDAIEPTEDEPASDEPTEDEPASDEPTEDEPASDEPTEKPSKRAGRHASKPEE